MPSFSYTKFFWVLWSQSFIGYFVYLLWIKKYFSPRFRVLATYTPAVCHPPAIRR